MKSPLFAVLLTVLLFSCGPSKKFQTPPPPPPKPSTNNLDIQDIVDTWQNINTSTSEIKDPEAKTVYTNELKAAFSQAYQKVKLKDVATDLFDPANSPCILPEKVKKKLAKLKEDGKAWIPQYVNTVLSVMPDSALSLSMGSISVLLHTVTVKSPKAKGRPWPVLGAPTFRNLAVDQYIITQYPSFIYTLDCSGYLNASLEASASVPGIDLISSAKSALQNKTSMFIGGGVVISPIAVAFYGNVFGIPMDTATRIEILRQLEKIPDTKATDSIECSVSYEAIWSSSQGDASFNGEGKFGVSGGVSFGIGKASGGLEAGGKVGRESSYSTYRTYFTTRKVIENLRPFTIADVTKRRKELERKQ